MAKATRRRLRHALFSALILLPGILPNGPVHAQAETEVQNLRAFAKLYGYVRYFHPSDEAAALDWEAFAALGVSQVKGAQTPAALQAALEGLFLPVAPTVRLYQSGGPAPDLPAELTSPDAQELEVVAWQHLGVGLGSANSIYKSVRLNRETVLSGGPPNAVLIQCTDAGTLSGEELRLTGLGKAMEPGAMVQLWLRVDFPNGEMGFFDNMMDRPVRETEWTEMTILGHLDEGAAQVCFGGIFLNGEGGVDDILLEVRGDGAWNPAPVQNGGFEEGETGSLPGWTTPTQGWRYAPAEAEAPSGDRYLKASQDAITFAGPLFEEAPAVGEVAEKPLGRGLVARIPLALFSRDGHTLGTPDPLSAGALSKMLAAVDMDVMTAEDQALRLADVVMAWNIFQHFYPYFDVVDTDWDEVLSTALSRALSDRTAGEFLATLRWMVSQLQDGHGFVSGPSPQESTLPLAFDWIEDQVVVVASDDPELARPGDVLGSIDGVPATERVELLESSFSGSPQWRRWRALSRLAWGTPRSEAVLELEREGERWSASGIRDVTQPPREARPDNIQELEPGIFYVNLDQVEIAAFQERVEELAAARGVVFDLRGYPAGNHMALTYLTDENLNSAFWRVPKVIYPDGDGEFLYRESRWDLSPSQPRFQGKIVFLTDGRAISYAESVMGIVEAYGLGEIVGAPTAGANGNVNPFILPGGFRISWTGMRVVKHDGSQHHLVGIRPTIPMNRTIQGAREGRDELLERAVEVIRGG